jgi:hypothetical protein
VAAHRIANVLHLRAVTANRLPDGGKLLRFRSYPLDARLTIVGVGLSFAAVGAVGVAEGVSPYALVLAVGAAVFLIVGAFVWFEANPEGLILKRPLGDRTLAWEDIAKFETSPASRASGPAFTSPYDRFTLYAVLASDERVPLVRGYSPMSVQGLEVDTLVDDLKAIKAGYDT